MRNLKIILAGLTLLLTSTGIGQIYVNQGATLGANNGTSWSDAFTDLQDAIDAASNGDELWIRFGSYKPTALLDRSATFNIINKDISLYGGFSGTETTLEEREWNINDTRISGNIGNTSVDTDNSYRLFVIFDSDVLLDGLSMERTYRDFSDTSNQNGVVYATGTTSVTINACDVRSNHAASNPGIFASGNVFVTIANSVFHDNESDFGSLVSMQPGVAANIYGCTFSENTFDAGFGSIIGGNSSTTAKSYNSIFWNNPGISDTFGSNSDVVNDCLVDLWNPGTNDSFANIYNVDPNFQNPGFANFELGLNSPVLDLGNPGNSFGDYDRSGGLRIWNEFPDLGAFESEFNRRIYVDASASGLNIGNTWADAFTDVQLALGIANTGDQIWVANGFYKPTSTNDRSIAFEMKPDVPMYGGFSGNESSLNERDWISNLTVLTGNIGFGFLDTDNSENVIRADGAGGDFVLDGFVVQKGYADGTAAGFTLGGGIYVTGANTFQLDNCFFFDNYASFTGAAAVFTGVTNGVTSRNCVFQSNSCPSEASCLAYDVDVYVENMFAFQNDGASLITTYAPVSSKFYGATFTENTLGANVIDGTGGDPVGTIGNSIIWGNNTTSGDLTQGISMLFEHCVLDGDPLDPSEEGPNVYFEDPLFTDAGAGDYEVCPGSVAYNGGANGLVDTDFDALRNDRIQDGTVDIGALESDGLSRILYVDKDASGANDGSSWTNAYVDLQDALTNALCGDEIWVAEGTYKPTTSNDRSIAFEVPADVSLYGGFVGDETERNQRDYATNGTALSGAIGSQTDLTDNSFNVVRIDDGGKTARIDGFRIRRAYMDLSDGFTSAAIRVSSGDVNIANCIFNLNSGGRRSVLTVSAGETTLENCVVFENHSFDDATVEANTGSAILNIIGCTFADNTTDHPLIPCIGGYTLSTTNIYNTIFWNNTNGSIGSADIVDHCFVEEGFGSGTNILTGDPLFVDAGSDNYRLQVTSTAINAGLSTYSNEALDLDHNDRTFGTIDLGAYEFSPEGVIFVDQDATGANDGSSWEDAYTDLQDAMAAFSGTEHIWVAEGIYYPTSGTDRYASFDLELDMRLYGGFNGTELSLGQHNPSANPTILSGEIGNQSIRSDNTHHIVTCINVPGLSVLDGFIIEDANALTSIELVGAGMRVEGEFNHPLVNDCVFRANEAANGSSISIRFEATASVTNCEFNNNFASGGGAGISCLNLCHLNCFNSSFTGNDGSGATAISTFGTMDLANCDFNDNTATGSGAALGLAVYDFTIQDCRFDGNHGVTWGGLLVMSAGGSAEFQRCEFTNNTGEENAAIYRSFSPPVTFANCLFDGNTGANGALFTTGGGEVDLINCTVVNTQSIDGFAPSTFPMTADSEVRNCIFWNNQADQDISAAAVVTNTLHRESDGTNGNTHYCPNFTPGGYYIGSNSPAYNSGNNADVLGLYDIDGVDRIVEGTVDMGCFEAEDCTNYQNNCTGALELEVDGPEKWCSTECTSTTGEPVSSCQDNSDRSAWFKFTAPATGGVSITTPEIWPDLVNFGIHITVYSGSCGSLTEIACVDDAPYNVGETLTIIGLTDGETYFVKVGGFGTQPGTWTTQVESYTYVPCFGDLNADGTISTADLLVLLGEYGCTSGCTADLSGDGEVSTPDILAILGVFGTDCPL